MTETIARSGSNAGRKRKHEGTHAAALEEISWTAARCFRLLRSIESRIAILRRISPLSDNGNRNRRSTGQLGSTPSEEQAVNLRSKGGSKRYSDPVWLPETKLGRNSNPPTYVRRGRPPKISQAPSGRKSDPGSFQFSSPLLRRFRTSDSAADAALKDKVGFERNIPSKARGIWKLPVKHTSDYDNAEKQLETALSNVLTTTHQASFGQTGGARALKSLCLRRVHAYIQLEDEFAEDDGREAKSQSTFEVYNDLESLGAGGDAGWRGLRELVRAHCISLIQGAIDDGLLSTARIANLIELCDNHGAVTEGQSLILSWLSASSQPTLQQLDILEAFCRKHECYNFLFRTWQMIRPGYPSLLRSLVNRPGFDDVFLKGMIECQGLEGSEFLRDYLTEYGRVTKFDQTRPKQCRSSYTSGMAQGITRITLVAASLDVLPAARDDRQILGEHILRAAIRFSMEMPANAKQRYMLALRPFFMAALILAHVHPGELFGSEDVDTKTFSSIFAGELNLSTGSVNDDDRRSMVEFARQFANGILALEKCLQVGLTPPLLSRLGRTEDICQGGGLLLQNVRMELAIASSRSTHSDRDDPEFLEEVSKIMAYGSGQSLLETPSVKTAPQRLRWEESICEWMLATPKVSLVEDVDDDVSDDSADESYDGSESEKEDQFDSDTSDGQSVVTPSSPDVLSQPILQTGHAIPKYPNSAMKRAKRARIDDEVYTPARRRSRDGFFERKLTASPDEIVVYRCSEDRQSHSKTWVPESSCIEVKQRARGKENLIVPQNTLQHRVQIHCTANDDTSEDELA